MRSFAVPVLSVQVRTAFQELSVSRCQRKEFPFPTGSKVIELSSRAVATDPDPPSPVAKVAVHQYEAADVVDLPEGLIRESFHSEGILGLKLITFEEWWYASTGSAPGIQRSLPRSAVVICIGVRDDEEALAGVALVCAS